MPQFSSLVEQVVLITGAAGGIGSAIAHHLAQRYLGIRLVLTDYRQEELEQCAMSCRQTGAEVLIIPADLTDSEQLQTIPKVAVDHFGQVNALINNAGYSHSSPVETIPAAIVEQHFQVNVFAPLALIQALTPVMRRQGGGRIINVSSIAGRLAFPFEGVYGASRFALEGLSDALRMEVAPFNIQVIVVELGAVRTKALTANMKALSELIAEPQNSLYSAAAQQLSNLAQEVEQQAWTTKQVAEIIQLALTVRHPRSRYVAASIAVKFPLLLMTKLLPDPIIDKFRQRLYGINLVVEDWQHH